jgi:hypothetical protein
MSDMVERQQLVELVDKLRGALGLDNDDHARHNLYGAIVDAEHNAFDAVCLCTMKRVNNQLAEVETILEEALSNKKRGVDK